MSPRQTVSVLGVKVPTKRSSHRQNRRAAENASDLLEYNVCDSLIGTRHLWEVPHGANTQYGSHGYVRYIGKFPAQIARELVRRYSTPEDAILDPMCGGGTTLAEAMIAGRPRVIGYDVNPVALTISAAATSRLDPQLLASSASRILEILASHDTDAPTLFRGKRSATIPTVDLFGNERFFSATTIATILRLRNAIQTDVPALLRPFFMTCLFDIMRRVSYCNVKKMNIELDEHKAKVWTVEELFPKILARNISLNADFVSMATASDTDVRLLRKDGRTFDEPDESVGLVVAHPPYMSNTAFCESTQLQLAFLGVDHKTIWKQELRNRGSYLHEPNGVKKYLTGWCSLVRESARVLRVGGHLAAVVGDGQVDGVRIPVGRITQEFIYDAGMQMVLHAEHLLNNNTGRTLNKRMKTQHIIVAKKVR